MDRISAALGTRHPGYVEGRKGQTEPLRGGYELKEREGRGGGGPPPPPPSRPRADGCMGSYDHDRNRNYYRGRSANLLPNVSPGSSIRTPNKSRSCNQRTGSRMITLEKSVSTPRQRRQFGLYSVPPRALLPLGTDPHVRIGDDSTLDPSIYSGAGCTLSSNLSYSQLGQSVSIPTALLLPASNMVLLRS